MLIGHISTQITTEISTAPGSIILQVWKFSDFLFFFPHLHLPGRLPMGPSTYATTATTSMTVCCPVGDIARKGTFF